MATWSIESGAAVNAEGNLLTFPIKVAATGSEFDDSNFPSADDSVVDTKKITNILGWRFDLGTGELPVAWSFGTLRKCGAAFDYAKGRTDVSRFAASSRILRIARF